MFISGFGGYNFLSLATYQSIVSKNGWLFISKLPSGPAPSLLLGFLLSKLTMRFLQSSLKFAGILRTPFCILLNNSSL